LRSEFYPPAGGRTRRCLYNANMNAASSSPVPTADARLAEEADTNFIAHAGWIQSRLPGMRVLDGGLTVIDSGLPCDTFNLVCRARLDSATAGERVRAAIDHFRREGRPFSWWVGPADFPKDLGRNLEEAGLEKAETELAMATHLSSLGADVALPEGLRIGRARSPREVADFAAVQAANWEPPDPQVLRFYGLAAAELLSEDCPLRLYVGYLGSEPVAAAEATLAGGVVGLYNVATRRNFRRRGFGAALTAWPLRDAREQGYRTAVLQAAAEGVRLYECIGFRRFGDITEYKPPPA